MSFSNIGTRLKHLRIYLNLTQEEVGARIKISKQTLYKYENAITANIPSDKIVALANIYNVSPAYLMGWEASNYGNSNACPDSLTDNPQIGANIKNLRAEYGLSQKDIAIIAGVSDKAVSTWENDTKTPRMGTIQKIANHFGMQTSNLIEKNGLKMDYYTKKSTADRLKEALSLRNMKPIELHEKSSIGKSAISQYLSGKVVPKHNKIYLMSKALDVNEGWLMGYDVPMERMTAPLLSLPTTKNEQQIVTDLKNIIISISDPATMRPPEAADDIAMLKASLEIALRLSERIAKRTYTPKKYRKE